MAVPSLPKPRGCLWHPPGEGMEWLVCGMGVLPFAGVSRGYEVRRGIPRSSEGGAKSWPWLGIDVVNTTESSSVEKHLGNNQLLLICGGTACQF